MPATTTSTICHLPRNAECRNERYGTRYQPSLPQRGHGIAPYGVLNQGRFQTAEGFKEREKDNPGRSFIPLSVRDKQIFPVLEDIATEKETDVV